MTNDIIMVYLILSLMVEYVNQACVFSLSYKISLNDITWQDNNLFKHAVFETFTTEIHVGISWYLLYL